VEETTWHNCQAWGKNAENIAAHCRKGSKMMFTGRIKTETWEKEGVTQYRTIVVVS